MSTAIPGTAVDRERAFAGVQSLGSGAGETRRIVLFGWLAEDRVSRADFDIDLAASSDRSLAVVSASLDSPSRVDCVDLANLHDSFREDIERSGKVLHEKR